MNIRTILKIIYIALLIISWLYLSIYTYPICSAPLSAVTILFGIETTYHTSIILKSIEKGEENDSKKT